MLALCTTASSSALIAAVPCLAAASLNFEGISHEALVAFEQQVLAIPDVTKVLGFGSRIRLPVGIGNGHKRRAARSGPTPAEASDFDVLVMTATLEAREQVRELPLLIEGIRISLHFYTAGTLWSLTHPPAGRPYHFNFRRLA